MVEIGTLNIKAVAEALANQNLVEGGRAGGASLNNGDQTFLRTKHFGAFQQLLNIFGRVCILKSVAYFPERG